MAYNINAVPFILLYTGNIGRNFIWRFYEKEAKIDIGGFNLLPLSQHDPQPLEKHSLLGI